MVKLSRNREYYEDNTIFDDEMIACLKQNKSGKRKI